MTAITDSTRTTDPDPLAGLPPLLSVPRTAALLGIPRATAYRYADGGHLPVRHFGRRVLVVTAKLRELITEADPAPARDQ